MLEADNCNELIEEEMMRITEPEMDVEDEQKAEQPAVWRNLEETWITTSLLELYLMEARADAAEQQARKRFGK